MDPMFVLAGISFGLAYVLGKQRSRVRLSEGHAKRRERILRSWSERDQAAIAQAQEGAATRRVYGPLSEAQQDTYRSTRERLDELQKAA